MKKIITIIAFALLAVTMTAKEVCKNSDTGLVLDETAGIYSLKGKGGIIPIGDIKETLSFMRTANKCFTQEKLKDTFDVGDQKFTVHSDDTGMYITKVGLGLVKVRPCDTAQFEIWLASRVAKEKAKKIWSVITE